MAKPQWGSKHICHSCGTRFYDLLRDPIVCSNCGAEFDPEALLKTQRSRAVTSEREEPVKRAKVRAPETDAAEEAEVVQEEPVEQGEAEDDQAADENEAAEGEEEGEKEEEKEDLIEDASELGDDEDDMAEVSDQDPEEER